MDQRRDILTPRSSLHSSKPVVTPPRSVAGVPSYGSAALGNGASTNADLELEYQQKLLEIDRMKSNSGYGLPELTFDTSRSKASPPGATRSVIGVRGSPQTQLDKELVGFRKGFSFAKVPSNLGDGTGVRRITAMISQPEKSLEAQQSSYAIERFLKFHGKIDVWTRGRSESKLLDADPNFHSFQDFKHVQSCDIFISIMNSAWEHSARCHQELELARKVHLTSAERGATAPGAPRKPIIIVIILHDEHSKDFDPLNPSHPLHSQLKHLPSLGHTILVHPARRIAGAELGSSDETSRWDEAAKATMSALRQACVEGGLGSCLEADVPGSTEPFALPAKPDTVSLDVMAVQAKTATELAAEASAAIQKLAQAMQALAAKPDSLESQVEVIRGGPGVASHVESLPDRAKGGAVPMQHPPGPPPHLPKAPEDPTMPWMGVLHKRYLGTLTHMLGGRMVWSLDISFEQVPLAGELEEGQLITGVKGHVRYTLLNYFPNESRPDPATAYWSKWCAVRIGHEALETLRCEFDPVQGLVLGDGVSVEQQNSFEDGEGALINPYQKYRMVLCSDGSLVGTLLAGGDWDAVFRATPF